MIETELARRLSVNSINLNGWIPHPFECSTSLNEQQVVEAWSGAAHCTARCVNLQYGIWPPFKVHPLLTRHVSPVVCKADAITARFQAHLPEPHLDVMIVATWHLQPVRSCQGSWVQQQAHKHHTKRDQKEDLGFGQRQHGSASSRTRKALSLFTPKICGTADVKTVILWVTQLVLSRLIGDSLPETPWGENPSIIH